MAKRRYSDEERAQALAALVANGNNVSRTARQLAIPNDTLRRWANGERHPEARQASEEKKASLAERLDQVAYLLLDAMPGKIEKASLQQVATSLGITIDKARLLRGEPTAINEEREDGRVAEFRKRYAALHNAPADSGADHDSQPVLEAPDAHGTADGVSGAGVP